MSLDDLKILLKNLSVWIINLFYLTKLRSNICGWFQNIIEKFVSWSYQFTMVLKIKLTLKLARLISYEYYKLCFFCNFGNKQRKKQKNC